MWEIYFWLIISILIIIGLCIGYWLLQRFLRDQALSHMDDKGLTSEFGLSELREMLKKGLINQDEFEKLKEKVIRDMNTDYHK
jgi:uncharacterized membrane protein